MAIQATTRRFQIQLSNVDTGLYTTLDLRIAQHPSETQRYMLARVVAYCYLSDGDAESVLQFSKGGLSSPEEPALSRTSLDGRLLVWCEIGTPSAERVHKASKAAPRVVVVTHNDPKLLSERLGKGHVHRKEALELWGLEPQFLDELAAATNTRTSELELTIAERQVYVNVAGLALCGALSPISVP
ncbi:MAG TPA: YaeQ family protein [Polyangiaceae bacterium]